MAFIQKSITGRMRAILTDWIIDVHSKFKLLPETLYLAVNIMDRYLEKESVQRQNLQLIGITALFIASKYEEIYPPELGNFVYVTDKAYTRNDILQMEGNIIKSLNFSFGFSSALKFLEIYEINSYEDKESYEIIKSLCRYLLELSLVEYSCVNFSQNLKTCSCIFLANKIINGIDLIENISFMKFFNDSGFCEEEIKDCGKEIYRILQHANKGQLMAVFRKFSTTKFLEVAKMF